ncbi:MAG TPA: chromate efflux transporter, partial [Steroidobacteraceae bacterium]|nr:chromate efflux transporter [Steroidobacteraceae bacterium]
MPAQMTGTPRTTDETSLSDHKVARSIFSTFLKLGLISFGGPIAHLAYFRDEFVTKRRWLTERSYADIIALCQFLPGPASSQVGMSLGLLRGGYRGALLAWLGFTLPSAILMMLFAVAISYSTTLPLGLLHGLKIVVVAVVAQAAWGMATQYCRTTARVAIMLACTAALLWMPTITTQLSVLVLSGIAGLSLFHSPNNTVEHEPINVSVGHRAAIISLAIFALLLVTLPLIAHVNPAIHIVDIFYRSGALVFGGGHVVLPLLQSQTVGNGLVSNETFLA